MEHSLRSYLERQSTAKLEGFLQDCLAGNVLGDYRHVIPIIAEVLARRAKREEMIPSAEDKS